MGDDFEVYSDRTLARIEKKLDILIAALAEEGEEPADLTTLDGPIRKPVIAQPAPRSVGLG